VEAIRRIVDPAGKRVADIGCGGGIYSQAWHALGADVASKNVIFERALIHHLKDYKACSSRAAA
jgi:2-polyprenyl-3-methyl-5-hydroxy-6-metoxy-1,4-benzoquinol methylase